MRILLFCISLIVVYSVATAQQFSPHYKVAINGFVYGKAAQLSNGNLVLYRKIDYFDGAYAGRLICLNPSGELVASFNKVFADGQISLVVPLSDGKLLISGEFTKINGTAVHQPVRLNADGTVDATFNSPLIGTVDGIAVQSAGRVIVNHQGTILRLDANGNKDNTFSDFGYVSSFAALAVSSTDEIFYSTYSGSQVKVFKLTAGGTPDNTFSITGEGTSPANSIQTIVPLADGKILVASDFNSYNGFPSKCIVRLLPNGEVDTSFSAGDKIQGTVYTVLVRGNKLVLSGNISYYGTQSASMIELNSDGTFASTLAVADGMIHSMFADNVNRITVFGEFRSLNNTPVPHLARFNTNGTLDLTLKKIILGANRTVGELRIDAENRAVVSSSAYYLDGAFYNKKKVGGLAVRVTPFGEPDRNFLISAGPYAMVFTSEVQADNKLILAGLISGGGTDRMARFNSNGSPDNTLLSCFFARDNYPVIPYFIKQIGTLLYVAGDFTSVNGMPSQSLVALNLNGSVSKTFGSIPAGSSIRQLERQSDGKLLLRGEFPHATGNHALIRINTDGTLDDTFQKTTFFIAPLDIAVDDHDNIYCAGLQLHPNGAGAETLIRLLPNGAFDPTLNIDNLFTTDFKFLRGVEALPDGRIAIGGSFKNLGGQGIVAFALLNANGTIIPIGNELGTNSDVQELKYSNGSVFLLGQFYTPDHTNAFGLAKFLLNPVSPAAPVNAVATVQGEGDLTLTWTHAGTNALGFIVEKSSGTSTTFTATDTVLATGRTFTDKAERGVEYRYRVRTINDAGFSPYSNTAAITWNPLPAGMITLTGISNGTTAELTWQSALKYHEGFRVEKATSPLGLFSVVSTKDANATGFSEPLTEGEIASYRVSAFNSAGVLTSDVVTIVITGVASDERAIEVYPNPTTERIFLKGVNPDEAASIRLLSSDGKTFYRQASANSSDEISVDVADMPGGLYVLHYRGKQNRFRAKVVKR